MSLRISCHFEGVQKFFKRNVSDVKTCFVFYLKEGTEFLQDMGKFNLFTLNFLNLHTYCHVYSHALLATVCASNCAEHSHLEEPYNICLVLTHKV